MLFTVSELVIHIEVLLLEHVYWLYHVYGYTRTSGQHVWEGFDVFEKFDERLYLACQLYINGRCQIAVKTILVNLKQ